MYVYFLLDMYQSDLFEFYWHFIAMRRSLIHDSRILDDSFNSLIKMISSAMITLENQ